METLHSVSGQIFFTFLFQSNIKIRVGTKLSTISSLCYTKAYTCLPHKILRGSLAMRRQELNKTFLCSYLVEHVTDTFCNKEAILEGTMLVLVSPIILFY